ncbi:MAG: xanthine dehydrogenase accessory protein XdhC [Pseudomonadota bacterium]
MSFELQELKGAVALRGPVIRVVVAEVRGSTPREPGASMLVWSNGQSGTIGGGALELAAVHAARAQLAGSTPARVTRHPLGPSLGQCCGGAVTLVSEIWDSERLEALGQTHVAVRRVSGEADQPFGLRAALRDARSAGTALSLTFASGWIAEPVTQATRAIWIHGAGHVGRALVAVLAPLPDIDIIWTDTGPERFPNDAPQGVTVLPAADPVALLDHATETAEHFVLTYSHDLDLRLCDRLLRRGFGRAGLIGSATKWARFRSRLAALGHSPDAIDRITCPIGDPALGKAPQQIAIGVARQLLADGPPRAAIKPTRQETA